MISSQLGTDERLLRLRWPVSATGSSRRSVPGPASTDPSSTSSSGSSPGEAPGPEGTDEKEVVLLCVDKPVKAGSKVS